MILVFLRRHNTAYYLFRFVVCSAPLNKQQRNKNKRVLKGLVDIYIYTYIYIYNYTKHL